MRMRTAKSGERWVGGWCGLGAAAGRAGVQHGRQRGRQTRSREQQGRCKVWVCACRSRDSPRLPAQGHAACPPTPHCTLCWAATLPPCAAGGGGATAADKAGGEARAAHVLLRGGSRKGRKHVFDFLGGRRATKRRWGGGDARAGMCYLQGWLGSRQEMTVCLLDDMRCAPCASACSPHTPEPSRSATSNTSSHTRWVGGWEGGSVGSPAGAAEVCGWGAASRPPPLPAMRRHATPTHPHPPPPPLHPQMEAHLCSYDHHHRKRLAETRAMLSDRSRKDRSKKEKRRQEREAARMAAQ